MVVVGVPALVAGPAGAATQTITVTASGFVPMNLTIKTGDTIDFTNTDTAAHQVLFKATTGFTCTVTPLVVQPSKTQSCTWTVPATTRTPIPTSVPAPSAAPSPSRRSRRS